MKITFTQGAKLTEGELLHLIQLFIEEEIQLELLQIEELEERVGKDTGKEKGGVLEQMAVTSVGGTDLHLLATIEHNAYQVVAKVELTPQKSKQTEVYTYRKAYPSSITPQEIRRLEKQSVAHALVKVLETWTGIKQPWGILTGVRPTKLMHRFRIEGRTESEIRDHFEDHLLLQPEKNKLLHDIVQRQVQVVPDFDRIDQEVSIYIGIPFCPTKCAYCTFPAYAINRKGNVVEQFLQGLELEIKEIGTWLNKQQRKITTIYFGGGTPTSIEAEEMDRLFQVMQEHFGSLLGVRELTVEAGRPDTITPEKLEVMKKWGVDRISINPQSFTQETLDIIGRHHTVEETLEKYQLARKYGLHNINMDLIIGLPGEGVQELEHSLKQVQHLRPESLTVHTLSFKRASTMTKNKEKYKVADRDEIKEMMAMATRWTTAEGYHPYYLYRQKNILGNLENVGYALSGQESIYNIMIMEEAQTIIGLGCGAVSKIIPPHTGRNTRWPNPKDPQTYIATYESMIKQKIEDLDRLYT